MAIKDVSVAFLQSDKYPEGIIKYICFKWPLTGQWRYFKQSGPIYGEASAPIRWENTLAPYLESEGFERGKNDPCAFHHKLQDIVNILWVDDDLIDADEDGVKWTSDKLDNRFKCKDVVWVEPMGEKVDYLGMELSQDDAYTYISMCAYIANCLRAVSEMLGIPIEKFTPCNTPMNKQIDPDTPALNPEMSKNFYTMCGFMGWLQMTMRLDVALLYSRSAQHLSKPKESAMATLVRGFRYLKRTINLCLAAPRYTDELELSEIFNKQLTQGNQSNHIQFYSDSDYAGNTEPQNKSKNQYGFVAMENHAPVDWFSKCTSVAFAHPDIGESHADISVAAGEIYAAGNAACEMLQLSYIADEVGVDFPKPAILHIDNTAAEAFAKDTVIRTKLKHIDVRQDLVKALNDHNIIVPKHTPSADNLADFLTKLLSDDTFIRLRDQMMIELPEHLQYHFE